MDARVNRTEVHSHSVKSSGNTTKLVDYEPINCVVILAHYANEPIRWRLIWVITKREPRAKQRAEMMVWT